LLCARTVLTQAGIKREDFLLFCYALGGAASFDLLPDFRELL